jgi:hypothetical protein
MKIHRIGFFSSAAISLVSEETVYQRKDAETRRRRGMENDVAALRLCGFAFNLSACRLFKFFLYISLFCLVGCGKNMTESGAPQQESRRESWPKPADWQRLNEQVHGRLIQVTSPLEACTINTQNASCKEALDQMLNPFFLEDQPGATQSTGWLGAWTSAISPYAVAVESTEDVVATVNFAREHKLKLVIKGTGHDYLGRSSAPNSLLLWTHKMRAVTLHDSFMPSGCPETTAGIPAVTIEAGARWLEAYEEVTGKHGLYVQGGGCTSVGAAGGFIQGGGFGSYSRKYGTGGAGLLEAEVVTADGRVLIANAYQNEDLFWALRGGGGGTFGAVTKMTLRVHDLPSTLGQLEGVLSARTDQAFKDLIEQFIHFYREKLHNEHWGESIQINQNNSIHLHLEFQGLEQKEVEDLWQPLKSWMAQQPEEYSIETTLTMLAPNKVWDYAYLEQLIPQALQADNRKGHPKGYQWWWTGDHHQVSTFWYTYQSRWLPMALFEEKSAKSFAQVLFNASRVWEGGLELHFNKGLSGASADAIERGRETPMNPVVYDAAALVIMAAGKQAAYPGIEGHEVDTSAAEGKVDRLNRAMKIITDVTPASGSYLNEADYFQKDWQHAFWGEHYSRLLDTKKKYDPYFLFRCHHCVGSQEP